MLALKTSYKFTFDKLLSMENTDVTKESIDC